MKLYYSPGACSLSPHIVLLEAGLPFTAEKTNLKIEEDRRPARIISPSTPRDRCPALQFDDGQVLTEGPAIVQYLADQKPESGLAPPAGTLERYRLMEMLNYISVGAAQELQPAVQSERLGRLEEGGGRESRQASSTGCRRASRRQEFPAGRARSRWPMPICSPC